MAKKDQKSKKIHEMEVDSSPTDSDETAGESTSSDRIPAEEVEDASSEEQMSVSMEESASEDLLDDVRRALIEEESNKNTKETKWWRRLGRKEKRAEPEPPSPIAEIDLPAAPWQTDTAEDQKPKTEPDEYEEQIEDLLEMLKTEPQESNVETSSVVAEAEPPYEPEPEIAFEQLKEQVFRPRTPEEDQSDSDVRSIALADGEEVFVEVEAKSADPFDERLKGMENALRPYRRYLYMTVTFLGVVMAVLAFLLIFNAYRANQAPVKEVSNLPYPVAVKLPGGWSFDLGMGTLQGGNWEPGGAEWLQGTEVCRWVSLPWSRQLEAVIRTLNSSDPIELVMSNNDKLVYAVDSVHEMTPADIQKLDSNSPCLLLILTGSDSDKRWVLRALP